MKFFTIHCGLLSFGPRVSQRGGRVVAVSGWKSLLLTLGLSWKRVTVDAGRREVVVERRIAWLFRRRRRYRFDGIRSITYGYRDWSLNPFRWLSYLHDTFDVFSVGLRLHDDVEVPLFSFCGNGTLTGDGAWPFESLEVPDDLLRPRQAVPDFAGTQELESRSFVDLLGWCIGKRVEPASA